MMPRALALSATALVAASCGSPDGRSVTLPGGKAGIGFDDLRYSATLGRVLAPAGRTGSVALVDPDTLAVRTIQGFSASDSYDGGHDFGATSVDEDHGLLFVTDRTSQKASVVDPLAGAVVGSLILAASPDYARYVSATNELWIAEPAAAQIEVLALSTDVPQQLSSVATIPIANGPESLVIDQAAGRAYTHRWQSTSVVIDVRTRAIVAEWRNGCAALRGLAVDGEHGFFFAGCDEGTLSVLDTNHGGRVLSSIARGAGFDVVGYNPKLGHLYMAGTVCHCLMVLSVNADGLLTFLDRFNATSSAHCAVADDRAHAWFCDPDSGKLWRVDDPYPASF